MLFMPSKTLKALKRNEKCGERVFFFIFQKKRIFIIVFTGRLTATTILIQSDYNFY